MVASKVDAIWADLASPDAKTAFAAVLTMRTNPDNPIALLQDRVKPPTVPAEVKIAAWLKQLDSTEFVKRDEAQKALTNVAELIQPHLDAARKGASLEVIRRLDLIRESATEMSPDLRFVRVCEVLEGIGTNPAAKALQAFAAGPSGAKLTAEAKDSVDRLATR